MSEATLVKLDGALTLATAAARLAQPLPQGDLVLDLGGISEVDSSALALLLAWLRRARSSGTKIALRALPAPLVALAQLYGLDELLPVEA